MILALLSAAALAAQPAPPVAAEAEIGFPYSQASVLASLGTRFHAGLQARTTVLLLQQVGLEGRAALWRNDRARVDLRAAALRSFATELFASEFLADAGQWAVDAEVEGATLTPTGGFFLRTGVLANLEQYQTCLRCSDPPRPMVVPSAQTAWAFPIMIGGRYEVAERWTAFWEGGVEMRLHFPNRAVVAFPVPRLGAGVTWGL